MDRRKFLKGLGIGAALAGTTAAEALVDKVRKAKTKAVEEKEIPWEGAVEKQVEEIVPVMQVKEPVAGLHRHPEGEEPNWLEPDVLVDQDRVVLITDPYTGKRSLHDYNHLEAMSMDQLVEYFKANP